MDLLVIEEKKRPLRRFLAMILIGYVLVMEQKFCVSFLMHY
jgi:hypothetical protein